MKEVFSFLVRALNPLFNEMLTSQAVEPFYPRRFHDSSSGLPQSYIEANVMIGQTISHYKILEKLGEGGMGVVYKAHDTRLDRDVALKFLPHHLTATEAEQARFLHEARAASALNHPNICAIHSIGEDGDQQFIEMEYVEGKTLRQVIPIQKTQIAIDYAIQIGEALQEAHSKGIVHRDVKADNIMVNSKNQIKVMDFGLAKLKGSLKLTKTSSTVGTLAYMAPEQIQGGEVDARSDIFSFGVVMFEMLTGRLPFRGEHDAAMMYSIVNEAAETLKKYLPDASSELLHVMNRALEKDPEDRYQHVDDMVSELRKVKKQSTRIVRTSLAGEHVPESAQVSQSNAEIPSLKRKNRPLMIAGALIGLIVLASVSYVLFFATHKSIDRLAVLPFVNVNADSSMEYLSDGITESLINSLSQLSNLAVMSRSSVFHYKGIATDPQKTGRELGVKAVLTGRVTLRGESLVISTELIDVSNNIQIWGDQYERKLVDLLSVQREVTKDISEKLRLKLTSEERQLLAKEHTDNGEAYQAYLRGLFWWNKRTEEGFKKAIGYFNQAIEKDPNYALAYTGLADSYALFARWGGLPQREANPKIKAAAMKALEIDKKLGEAHNSLGWALWKAWEWTDAEREFKRAIELNPGYATGHQWYGIFLGEQGRQSEAASEMKRAEELDPLSVPIATDVGRGLFHARHYDQALEQCRSALDLDLNFWRTYLYMGEIYIQLGRHTEAVAMISKARQLFDNQWVIRDLGYAYAVAGKKQEARKVLDELNVLSNKRYIDPFSIAVIYLGLGEKDHAFEWLQKAVEDESSWLTFLKVGPEFDGIRSDPRFTNLLRRTGLEQ